MDFVPDRRSFPLRSKRKKYPYLRCTFSQKTLKKLWVNFISTLFLYSLEKMSMEARNLLQNPIFFRKTLFTLILKFQPYYLIIPRSRRQIYVNLGKISTGSEKVATGSERDYHWATVKIRVNSSSVKGEIISSSLFCSR